MGGAWAAQSPERPTLDFSSGHDPRVMRSSPVRLCAGGWSLLKIPSLPPPLSLSPSLSSSVSNKIEKQKIKHGLPRNSAPASIPKRIENLCLFKNVYTNVQSSILLLKKKFFLILYFFLGKREKQSVSGETQSLTSARVTISRFVSSSPESGSLPSVRSRLRILCPPRCPSPPSNRHEKTHLFQR